MKLLSNIKNYLYNNDYFIDITPNQVHIYNYQKIATLTNHEIVLIFAKFKTKISGTSLTVRKILKNEMLIKGLIESVVFLP